MRGRCRVSVNESVPDSPAAFRSTCRLMYVTPGATLDGTPSVLKSTGQGDTFPPFNMQHRRRHASHRPMFTLAGATIGCDWRRRDPSPGGAPFFVGAMDMRRKIQDQPKPPFPPQHQAKPGLEAA